MIRVLVPVFAVLLVLGCLLLSGRGLDSLGDPFVVVAILFIVATGCFPLLRRAIVATAARNERSKPKEWLAQVPWAGMILIWNGLGTALTLCAILSIIMSYRYSIRFPYIPSRCMSAFFWLWFLPMPFVTVGSVAFLWRSRGTVVSKALLFHSLVVFVLWSCLVVMVIAYTIPVV